MNGCNPKRNWDLKIWKFLISIQQKNLTLKKFCLKSNKWNLTTNIFSTIDPTLVQKIKIRNEKIINFQKIVKIYSNRLKKKLIKKKRLPIFIKKISKNGQNLV